MFHVYDGYQWHKYQLLKDAEEHCKEALKVELENAIQDGEWAASVNEIAIYEGPDDAEYPCDLPCVLMATPVNEQRPSSDLDEEGYHDEDDWWESSDSFACSYEMVAPATQPN